MRDNSDFRTPTVQRFPTKYNDGLRLRRNGHVRSGAFNNSNKRQYVNIERMLYGRVNRLEALGQEYFIELIVHATEGEACYQGNGMVCQILGRESTLC
jgi:hypothetical protein